MARTFLTIFMCVSSFMLFFPNTSFTGETTASATCSCPGDCKCEHCTTGKGACACQVGAKGKCACGPDCKCEHCTTGKGACACRAGSGKGAAAPGASKGLFSVAYKTDMGSLPLNKIHAWTITVTDAQGKPVTDAEISIDGGMPAHGHGLPTQPEVTKNLGDGSYLVEGVKFSMPGEWVMTFTVKSGGKEDTVVLEFGL